ncbi:hypothetical protein AC1031_011023 [Aphanomyces cochlioides]|nr:hypothetical protein AC1031_011023 [Aphanomyces cochlioides]
MIEHVVLFKWKADADPAKVEEVGNAIKALKDKIPGIVDLAYGEDITKTRAQGFTHGLVVRMATRETVKFYDEHPEHVQVVHKIREVVESVLAMDFESPRLTPN